MRRRIAILFDTFGPYHVARMLGATAHADVIAVEATPAGREYDWDRPAIPAALIYLPLIVAHGGAARMAELDARLAPLAPDCIALPGWSSRAALAALAWATRRGVPAIVMSESNGWDFARNAAAEWIKRRIVAHYAAGLVTSASQAGYLAALGLSPAAIFRGYNVVDNACFARAAADVVMPDELAEAARGRYFLASSRFIAKKNLARLLDAYALFRQGRGDDPYDWPLVLLGDGGLRGALEARRTALGLARHVIMPGFRQIDQLPRFYGAAGAFVHAATTEQWGLVVNEAMASGLPVAVSKRCGCAEILVDDGDTGMLFDPFDVSAIARTLRRLTDRDAAKAMAARGLARIAHWSPERFGAGIAAAADAALASPAHPRLLDRTLLAGLAWR